MTKQDPVEHDLVKHDPLKHDPLKQGWMQGFPPAKEKLIRFEARSFYAWPQLRWSLSHLEELVPTKNVWRGPNASRPLPYNLQSFNDAVITSTTGEALNWQAGLAQTYTDGLIVLHRGKVLYEDYFGASGPHIRHVIQSANKSFVGILAESLIAEGRLDADALVPTIIPELKDSAFGDATVQQVLDMLISMVFYEDYLDPASEIWRFHRATGMAPPQSSQGAEDASEVVADVLPRVKKDKRHGEAFAYREPNIFVLGWIVRRAAGQDIASQLSDRIWQHIGAEHDGYYLIDGSGAESSSGFTLRDFARFGELLRTGGRIDEKQLIPGAVIDKIFRGGNPQHFAKAGLETLPGWSYKSQWWLRHIDGRTCAVARGAHGQVLYIDRENELVVARTGSFPKAPSVQIDPIFLPMLDEITKRVSTL
jgi:CubicO group peptidase (beta-lactamase class C family)